MARKSGGFNRILNFIGLVDDGEPQDTYGEEYQSDKYGRQQPYVPANRQRQTADRRQTAAPTRQTASPARQTRTAGLSEPRRNSGRYDDGRTMRTSDSRSLSTYSGRQGTASRSYGGYDDVRTGTRRSSSRFADEVPAYDYSQRPERSSRFSEPQPAPTQMQKRPAQGRNANVSGRTRTVMFSLHTLEDCCAVIDELIANNTVVLTMDEMEGSLMQRAVDTLSGAVFALSANIRKASDKTYLITPMSVEVNEAYDVERRF